MLVLSRKKNESIIIDDQIRIGVRAENSLEGLWFLIDRTEESKLHISVARIDWWRWLSALRRNILDHLRNRCFVEAVVMVIRSVVFIPARLWV